MNHPDSDHHPPPDDGLDDALRALVARAGSLPTLRPSRDLWPGIVARLDTGPPLGHPEALAPARPDLKDAEPAAGRVLEFRTPRAVRIARWPRLAAAAVALATLSSGATYLAMRRPGGDPAEFASQPNASVSLPTVQPSTAAHPNASPAARVADGMAARGDRAELNEPRPVPRPHDAFRAVARSVDVAVPGAVDYDREIAELRTAVAERRGDLDSATVDVLTRNLRIIDAAIAASRAALARDPRSPFLGEQLTRSLGQKVELLRTVALLPHT